MARMSKKKAKEAILAYKGNMSKAAEACSVSRGYFYVYVKDHDLWGLVIEERDKIIDNLEDKAFSVAMKGNANMLQFLLKTQGKHRGYVERQEIDDLNKSYHITVEKPDDE